MRKTRLLQSLHAANRLLNRAAFPSPLVAEYQRTFQSHQMPVITPQIRVFLADHAGMIRERVATMLASRGMAIVGHADTPHECIDGILATNPDVVVLEVQLEGGCGLQVLNELRICEPGIAWVVFTIHTAPAFCLRYLSEGAQRFLDKATQFHQLADAVEQAFADWELHFWKTAIA
jgi:FixJ family two-component response regulator